MVERERPDGRREKTTRTRHVVCEIARATVRATLRNGQGFQEPGRLYVRCEERDCQYADRNEPPCPLRVDMFRDQSDEVLRSHLAEYAGAPVCYGCLGTALGLSHEQVRDAAWRLTELPGCRVNVRPTRCAECRARRLTIRLTGAGEMPRTAARPRAAARSAAATVPDTRPPDEEARAVADVAQALMRAADRALCASCLAFMTARALDEARRIKATLSRDERFAAVRAACAACGREQDLIAVAGALAAE